jgi:hypothetical protein
VEELKKDLPNGRNLFWWNLKPHENEIKNFSIHPLSSVQVISQPGWHFALAANFHFFFT